MSDRIVRFRCSHAEYLWLQEEALSSCSDMSKLIRSRVFGGSGVYVPVPSPVVVRDVDDAVVLSASSGNVDRSSSHPSGCKCGMCIRDRKYKR